MIFPRFWGVVWKVFSDFGFGDRKCRFRDVAIRAILRFSAIATYKMRDFSKSPILNFWGWNSSLPSIKWRRRSFRTIFFAKRVLAQCVVCYSCEWIEMGKTLHHHIRSYIYDHLISLSSYWQWVVGWKSIRAGSVMTSSHPNCLTTHRKPNLKNTSNQTWGWDPDDIKFLSSH